MKKLREVAPLSLGFNKDLSLKDFSVKNFLKLKPDLENLVLNLIEDLPVKKYITIDYSELILEEGKKTCRNTGWHVDGKDNSYIILNFGQFRTKFLNKKYLSADSPQDIKSLNFQINEAFKGEKGQEIPEGVPVLYSSEDVHKGQVATGSGKRILLRICSSDYLTPKNMVLKK